MRFLINPNERRILNDAGDRIPLGLCYIAKQWNKVEPTSIYDLNHSGLREVIYDVKKQQPSIIGISCISSPMVSDVKLLCGLFKEISSKSKIVVGGYHPSVQPDDFKGYADTVVIGEGEKVNDFSTFIHNSELINLNELGIPERTLLDSSQYNMGLNGIKCATALTSRGCPNACVFCGNLNRNVRFHSLEDIANDLETVKMQGYGAVYFLDDVFTIKPERAKAIGNICSDLGLIYRATTRANYTTEDLISHMASTGCVCLSMGVESGNDEMLKRVGKNQTKEQITNAVKLCNKYNIPTKGFFIIGLPGETEDTARQTIEYARELKKLGMKTTDFYPMIPFPGTDVYSNPNKYGIRILNKDYETYLQAGRSELQIPCETYNLSAKRIGELIKEAKR